MSWGSQEIPGITLIRFMTSGMEVSGQNAIGMDDTPEEENGEQEEDTSQKPTAVENTAKIPYPIENAGWVPMTGGGRPPGMKVAAAMCDKPVQKMSLKEKLEVFKAQAAGADRADAEKVKRKEETL